MLGSATVVTFCAKGLSLFDCCQNECSRKKQHSEKTVNTSVEEPRLKGISNGSFSEFKRQNDLYDEHIEEERQTA